jgi:FixJ family two-component response regulator
MPQRAEVVLSDEEREVLERWARRPTSAQALALRCRIVLASADGEQSKEIAARLGISKSTVSRPSGGGAAGSPAAASTGSTTSRVPASRARSARRRSSG